MNGVDAALALVLTACALRGYWRGFFRETFGLLALVGGLVAALRFTAAGAVVVRESLHLPPPVDVGVAFVALFAVVHVLLNLVGVLLDRLAGGFFLRSITRVAGALFGVSKAAAVLAFILLLLHLFPVIPTLDGQIMSSAIGRPLVTVAGNVVRFGFGTARNQDSVDQT